MKEIVLTFLQLQSQMRILHWQTESYSEHKAFDSFYEYAGNIIDDIIESLQGKYGRILLGQVESLQLIDYKDVNVVRFLDKVYVFITEDIYLYINEDKDAEIVNQIQELRSLIDKTKYLLTLK